MCAFDVFINSNRFSPANYSAFLIGISELSLRMRGVYTRAGNVKYTAAAATAREKLIKVYAWTIEDGGQE